MAVDSAPRCVCLSSPKTSQDDSLPEIERRLRAADPSREIFRNPDVAPAFHVFDQLLAGVEALEPVELELGFEDEQAVRHRLAQRCLCPSHGVHELRVVELAQAAAARLGSRRGWDRVHVEKDSLWDERLVNPPQGVHDALRLNSSQRPAQERDVESLARDVESLGVRDPKFDPVRKPVG